MARKHLVLLGVLLATFFLISSLVAARELAETKYGNDHVGDAKQYRCSLGFGCGPDCCECAQLPDTALVACLRCCDTKGEVPDVETDVEIYTH